MKWTPEKLEELSNLIKAGKNSQQLADHFNSTSGAIRMARSRHGLPKFHRKWSGENLRILALLRAQGKSRDYIANYFGLSPYAIRTVVDRHGLKRRKYERVYPGDLAAIKELRDKGLSAGQIAIKLGQEHSRIKNILLCYERRAREGKGPWAVVK